MKKLVQEIKTCQVCLPHLIDGVNPVFSFSKKSKIIIIGQAPGIVVHRTGKPWDDKSGIRLRTWLGVTEDEFYEADNFAILPMSFCYPGKGKSGDLPPRKECAPLWHELILNQLEEQNCLILIGAYAQTYYLKNRRKQTLTETVKNFEAYLPKYFVLPHPSPRNNIWLKKNPWFEQNVLPVLKMKIRKVIA